MHYTVELDGINVCNKCGLCFEESTFETTLRNFNYSENNFKTDKKIDFLKELESRGVFSKNICENAIFFIEKWRKDKIPFEKYHSAYAIYHASKLNRQPFSIKEISKIFDIKVKDICKIEKYIKYSIYHHPCEYATRFCDLLNIKYQTMKRVCTLATEMQGKMQKSPPQIASAAIAAVCVDLNARVISDATCVPVSSMKKIMRDYAIIRNGSEVKLGV